MEDITEVNLVCKLNFLMTNLTISNNLVDGIKIAQETDEELQGFLTSLDQVKKWEDGVTWFDDRHYVPNNEELKKEVLQEAYQYKYIILLGVTKIYEDMKRMNWWLG